MTEENTNAIDYLPEIDSMTGVPYDISSSMAETVPLSEVTNMLLPKKEKEETALVTMKTFKALSENTIESQQDELDTMNLHKHIEAFAKPQILPAQYLEINEVSAQSQTDDLTAKKEFLQVQSKERITCNDSLITSETLTNMTTTAIQTIPRVEDYADAQLILQEAMHVTEPIISQSEEEYKPYKVTGEEKARGHIISQQSIVVTEVRDEMREKELVNKQLDTPVLPIIGMSVMEPLEISSVFVDDKSGKYYPELFVPTETATTKVISENQLVTQIINAPEFEGKFSLEKLPPKQAADLSFNVEEGIIISEQNVQDKEHILTETATPVYLEANSEYSLLKSISNFVPDVQMNECPFPKIETDERKADVELIEQQYLTNIVILSTEKENQYDGDKIKAKENAVTTFNLMEGSNISSVLVQESENELVQKELNKGVKASVSVSAKEHISTSEIQGIDEPTELQNDFKLVSEEIYPSIEPFNAKQVSFTVAHENEINEEFNMTKTQQVTTNFTPIEYLNVTDTSVSEKEDDFKALAAPQHQFSKVSSAHTLQTTLVEEVNLSSHTDILPKESVIESYASKNQSFHNELSIAESITSENAQPTEENKRVIITAQSEILEHAGLNIQQVMSNDKEEALVMDFIINEKFAKPDISSNHIVASTMEVNVEPFTSPIEKMGEAIEKADRLQTTLQSISVSSQQAVEKEISLDIFTKPEEKLVSSSIIEDVHEPIKVSQIISGESEAAFDNNLQYDVCQASPNVTSRNIAVSLELDANVAIGYIQPMDDVSHRKATLTSDVFNEVTVLQPDFQEKITSLDNFIEPKGIEANVNIISGVSISVEETVVNTNAVELSQPKVPDNERATVNITEKEAIVSQETMSHDNTSAISISDVHNETAKPLNEPLTIACSNEVIAAEFEGKHTEDQMPDQIKTEYNFIEQQGICISEIYPDSKEDILTLKSSAESVLATQNMESMGKVASKDEIILSSNTEEFNVKNESACIATTQHVPLTSVEQSECISEEREGMLNLPKIDLSVKAEIDIAKEESLVTTIIITDDKETKLLQKEKPKEATATSDVILHTSTQKTQVIPNNSLSDLEILPVQTSNANLQHTLLTSLVNTNISSAELEGILHKDILPNQKFAESLVDGEHAAITTETFVQDKESYLHSEKQILHEKATTEFSDQMVAQSSEVISQDSTTDIEDQIQIVSEAIPSHRTFEAILQTKQIPVERESELQTQNDTFSSKVASYEYELKRSLNVTEIFSQNGEINQADSIAGFKPVFENINIKDCAAGIFKVAQKSETLSEDNVSNVSPLIRSHDKAFLKTIPLESFECYEVQTNENEKDFEQVNLGKTRVAERNISEIASLNVNTVVCADNTGILHPINLPNAEVATTNLTSGKVAEKSEVIPLCSSKDFETPVLISTVAKSAQSTLDSVQQYETIINDKETSFERVQEPFKVLANIELQFDQSIITTETYFSEKESESHEKENEWKNALPTMDVNKMIAVQSSIIPDTHVAEHQNVVTSSVKAKILQTESDHITINENILPESEQEIKEISVPSKSTASTTIQEHDSKTVTEIIPHSKEGSMTTFKTPEKMIATTKLDTFEILEQTTVDAIESIEKLAIGESSFKSANIVQEPSVSLTCAQLITEERSSDLRDISHETGYAKTLLSENYSLLVSSSNCEEKEHELESPKHPREITAHTDFKNKLPLQQQEVISNEQSVNFETVPYDRERGTPNQKPSESIIVSENIIQENEGKGITQIEFKTCYPSKEVINLSSLSVSETVPDYCEGKLSLNKPVELIAERQIIHSSHITISETNPESNLMKLSENKFKKENVSIEYVPETGISVEEHFVNESEDISTDVNKLPSLQNAKIDINEKSCISVTEISLDEKEELIDSGSVTESKTAIPNIIEYCAVQNQIIISNSNAEVIQKDAVLQSQAQKTHIVAQHYSTTETPILQRESNLCDTNKEMEAHSNVTIEAVLSSASTLDVMVEDKEKLYETKIQPDSQEGIIKLETITAISRSDNVILESFMSVKKQTIDKPLQIYPKQDEMNSVTQQETITNDFNKAFDIESVRTQSARIVINENQGFNVNEIYPQYHDEELVNISDKPVTAQEEYIPNKTAMTSEIITEHSLKPIESNKETHLFANAHSEKPHESIEIKELLAFNSCETNTYPDTKPAQAKINIHEHSNISVDVVSILHKEGEYRKLQENNNEKRFD